MLAQPPSLPLDYQFPEDGYWHLMRTLRLTLPPPPEDTPEALLRRDHAAIATIAGLAPVNIGEARLAAQFVAASEQWSDCLRSAQLPETKPEMAAKCRAQAAAMMRSATSAMRALVQLQTARRKLEANHALSARADRIDHIVTHALAAALEAHAEPAQPAAPAPAPSLSPAEAGAHGPAAPAPEPSPIPVTAPPPQREPEDPEPDTLSDAEQYAAIYPERAALIRRLGRVPDNVTFGPPDDDLVKTLVTARTPALLALDRAFAEPRAA
jgi:hypothetical protein